MFLKGFRANKKTFFISLWWLCLGLSWIVGLGTMGRIVAVYLHKGEWAGDYSVIYTAADLLNTNCCESSFEMTSMLSIIDQEGLKGLVKLSVPYDRQAHNRHADKLSERSGGEPWIHSQYTLPPGFTALLRPLAFLDWPVSRAVWLILLLGSFGFSVGIGVRQGVPWWGVVSAVLFVPVLYGITVSNINILLCAFMLASWNFLWPRLRKQPSDFGGGVLIGLAAVAKLFLSFLLFEAILARRWKILAGALITALIVVLLGVLAGGGMNAMFAYVGMLASYKMEYTDPEGQSMISFWTRLVEGSRFVVHSDFFGAHAVDLPGVINAPDLVWPASVISIMSIMLLFVLTLRWVRGAARMAGLSLVGTLAFPVAWYHAHSILLFPWLLTAVHARPLSPSSWLIAISLLIYQLARFYPYFGKHVLLLNFPVYGALLVWVALMLTFSSKYRTRVTRAMK